MPGLGRFAKGTKNKQDETSTSCLQQPTRTITSSAVVHSTEKATQGENPINDNGSFGPNSSSYTPHQENSEASNDMFRSSSSTPQNLSVARGEQSSADGAPDFERFSMGFNGDDYEIMGNDVEFDSMVLEGYDADIVGGYPPVDQVSDFNLDDVNHEESGHLSLEQQGNNSCDTQGPPNDDTSSNRQPTRAIARFQRKKDFSEMSDSPSSGPNPDDVQANNSNPATNEENVVTSNASSSIPKQLSNDSAALSEEDSTSISPSDRNNGQGTETESNFQRPTLDTSPSPPQVSTKDSVSDGNDGQCNGMESNIQCPTSGTVPLPHETNHRQHLTLTDHSNSANNHNSSIRRYDEHMDETTDCLIVDCPPKGTLDGKTTKQDVNDVAHVPENLHTPSDARRNIPSLNYERNNGTSQGQKSKSTSISCNNTDTEVVLVATQSIQNNHQLHQQAKVQAKKVDAVAHPDGNSTMMGSKMISCQEKHSMAMDVKNAKIQDVTQNTYVQRDNKSAKQRNNLINDAKDKPTEPNRVNTSVQKIQTHVRAQTAPCAKEHYSGTGGMLPVTPSPPPPHPPRRRNREDSALQSSYHVQEHDHILSPYTQTNSKTLQPNLYKRDEHYLKHDNVSMPKRNIPSSNQTHGGDGVKQIEDSFSGIVSPASSTHTHPPKSSRQEQNFDDLLAAFTDDLVAAGDIWDRCDSQMVNLNVKLCISQNVALRLHADFDDILEEAENILESCDSEKKEAG
jgi:hypothetical protein